MHVGFAISVVVEVSLNLEGKERKEELDKLFKVSMAHLLIILLLADISHQMPM